MASFAFKHLAKPKALKMQVDGSVKVNEWCKVFVLHYKFKDIQKFWEINN